MNILADFPFLFSVLSMMISSMSVLFSFVNSLKTVFFRLFSVYHNTFRNGKTLFLPQKNGAAQQPRFHLKSAGFPAGQILADHQRHLENDGMVELTQVKASQLLDLFQAVDQSIAVNKQLPGGLGNV